MDRSRLQDDLRFVNQMGATLSVEERMKLELALQKLADTQKFDQLVFWGRIEGVAKDYYLAKGINFRGQHEFPTHKFFWSSNEFVFAELPEKQNNVSSFVELFREQFTGQHEKILDSFKDENADEFVGGGSDDENELKVSPKKFTELDRLSYVVRTMEEECSLVPVGAFKLSATHELRYNDAFKGLTIEQASNLDNYQHFTAPKSQEKKDYIARDEALQNFNFLDPIKKDVPKGCWSIQSDVSKTHVTVRSLVWPGFMGYCRTNSKIFGYTYFGYGIKNCDLAFLL